MDAIRTEKLFKRHPLFLRGRSHSIRKNLMAFGFECGPGWRALLEPVLDLAEAECRAHLRRGCKVSELPLALQIKEKFGTLRIYVSKGSESLHAAIATAQRQSAHVCETCGKPSQLKVTGWHSTVCDSCTTKELTEAQQLDKISRARTAKRRVMAEQLAGHYSAGQPRLPRKDRQAMIGQIFSWHGNHDARTTATAALIAAGADGVRDARAAYRKARRARKSLYHLHELLAALEAARAARASAS